MAPRRRNVTLATASAVALIGAASLVVTTYPHLLEKLPWWKKKSATEKKESEQDSSAETAENIGDSTVVVQENQLSETELKEVLKEKAIPIPEGATLDDLIALADKAKSV